MPPLLKNCESSAVEAAVTAMLVYNVICEGITPGASMRAITTIVMLAKIAGVDITNPTTFARIKRKGEMLIIGFSLGMASKSEYCTTFYGSVEKLEKIISAG